MKLPDIGIQTDGGPWVTHNMPCAVHQDTHAVYDMNRDVFLPSWKAQDEGWALVQAKSWLGRLVLRVIFDVRQPAQQKK